MKEAYSVRIERPGMGDVDDLVRTADLQVAAEVVRCLLACHDDRISRVIVAINRTVALDKAI